MSSGIIAVVILVLLYPTCANSSQPFPVSCPNSTLSCPSGNTCCKLAKTSINGYGCCPIHSAVCCLGGASCCPHGKKCKTTGIGDGYHYCESSTSRTPAPVIGSIDENKFGERMSPTPAPVLGSTDEKKSGDQNVTVSSIDESMAVTIDTITGKVVLIQTSTATIPTLSSTYFAGIEILNVSVQQLSNGSILVERITRLGHIIEKYTPDFQNRNTIQWRVDIIGIDTYPKQTVPITTAWTFDQKQELLWWAPWDLHSYKQNNKDSWLDPLQFKKLSNNNNSNRYNYGTVYATDDTLTDMIVAPIISIFTSDNNGGFSVQMNPEDSITSYTENWLQESLSNEIHQNGLLWHRENVQISSSTKHRLTGHIVSHTSSCFRPVLHFHVETYSKYWKPIVPLNTLLSVDGLGSYGSYPSTELGEAKNNLSFVKWKNMHYKVNWDLSGRFYHYMGMFAPPLINESTTASPSNKWFNRWNPYSAMNGGRLTYNVSYSMINENYQNNQKFNFTTLSYFNVFEFGMNIFNGSNSTVLPKPILPGSTDDYRNASLYVSNYLSDSVLTKYWYPSFTLRSTLNSNVIYNGVTGTWDNGLLMDPGVPSYTSEMKRQLNRRLQYISSFQGIVVDRSDYARYYNLNRNDNVSFINNYDTSQNGHVAFSFKKSYTQVIHECRKTLGNDKIMLMNTLGYSMISMMKSYDGTFSEGKAINAVGLLGAGGMISILWTDRSDGCCDQRDDIDVYFQRRLYLGIYPMAPLPAEDHCISANTTLEKWYVEYGGLFSAIGNNTGWSLYPAHCVSVINTFWKSTTFDNASNVVPSDGIKVNAFSLRDGRRVYPISLIPGAIQRVELQILEPVQVIGYEMLQIGKLNVKENWFRITQAVNKENREWNVTISFDGNETSTKRNYRAVVLRSILEKV